MILTMTTTTKTRRLAFCETLWLYEDRLVDRSTPFRRGAEYPLDGLTADVVGAGLRMGLTLSTEASLTIVGPGVVLTRRLKGKRAVHKGVDFAARVNAQVAFRAQ